MGDLPTFQAAPSPTLIAATGPPFVSPIPFILRGGEIMLNSADLHPRLSYEKEVASRGVAEDSARRPTAVPVAFS